MIIITTNTKRLAKFESFEGNKAMDWLTQKGLYVVNRFYAEGNAFWVVTNLP